jgi:hypothetical protein
MELWTKKNMDKFSDEIITPALDPGVTKKPKII